MRNDPNIGLRTAEEFLKFCQKNNISYTEASRRLDVSIQNFRAWERGVSPSAYALKKMMKLGFDIFYILDGKRHG